MEIRIDTKRLTLRTVTYEDSGEVTRMWDFENEIISSADAKNAIDWMTNNHDKNTIHKFFHMCLAVFEKDKDRIIGWCGLDGGVGNSENDSIIAIFFLVDKQFRNIGYATECGITLLDYGFNIMKVERIDGGCAKENIASRKVLEAIGMKHMKLEKDGSPTFYLTVEEYRSQEKCSS